MLRRDIGFLGVSALSYAVDGRFGTFLSAAEKEACDALRGGTGGAIQVEALLPEKLGSDVEDLLKSMRHDG